jgi:Outer membrane lipoprotein carrier protein LolA-like
MKIKSIRHCLMSLSALTIGAVFAPCAVALDVPELMKLLAAKPSGEARFTETRYVKELDRPLTASGTVSFKAPDQFSRHTLKPRPESMVVEGSRMTLERAGRKRHMELAALPEAAAMVEAVRGTLMGNRAALERHFRARISGEQPSWGLDLTPIDTRVYNLIRVIRLSGRQSDVLQVEVQLADGDRSVMVMEPVVKKSAP